MADYAPPVYRKLRAYAFDPSVSEQVDTALINVIVFKIRWEDDLKPGPCGEYIDVVDFDPASNAFYEPVDLNARPILADDGLSPSESNPQFHQQMVYAAAMLTIQNFEQALGRRTLWSARQFTDPETGEAKWQYIRQLRLHPHALREANAYYSPDRKAILFGYFTAKPADITSLPPGSLVFTCLSHDVVAHETTHALLDGIHERYITAAHPDTAAFHEAFADIVALFQRFTFEPVLEYQIAKSRGNLRTKNLLLDLATQVGLASGSHGSLRDAIGRVDPVTGKPDPTEYASTTEPHARGAILVATVFDAFLTIYQRRSADLIRIASEGTGILRDGDIHPDLVKRLAHEAAQAARTVLTMCIRALDYCPPVNITFGDYLRAVITADNDLVPDDGLDYRLAFIEAFKRRGIYPEGLRSISLDNILFPKVNLEDPVYVNHKEPFKVFTNELRRFSNEIGYSSDREHIYRTTSRYKARLHDVIADACRQSLTYGGLAQNDIAAFFETLTGLWIVPRPGNTEINERNGLYSFQVSSLQHARRQGPGGNVLNQIILTLTQKRTATIDATQFGTAQTLFQGGCTLIIDLDNLQLKYSITKPIQDQGRLTKQANFMYTDGSAIAEENPYYVAPTTGTIHEPFALIHRL